MSFVHCGALVVSYLRTADRLLRKSARKLGFLALMRYAPASWGYQADARARDARRIFYGWLVTGAGYGCAS
jgi:hypothetical protein